MNALLYLLRTRMKNMLKSLFRHPARLIYVIFLLAMLALTVFSGHMSEEEGRALRDVRELTGGAAALYTLMFLLLARSGFAAGSTIFSMQDVNLVFPAPLRRRSVLLYGLLRQIGTSLLLSFFLLFQYSWMHSLYGIRYPFLLILVLGYALSVFLGQFVAMTIYSLTASDERKQRIAKVVYYVYICLILVWLVTAALRDMKNPLPKLAETLSAPVFRLTPVGGWLGAFVHGAATGSVLWILLGLGLCVLLTAALFFVIEKSRTDYYEDVIKTAEAAQSAINASRQGIAADASPRNVRVGKTGFGRGAGAEMFYYKHRLENRRSRILIVDMLSLIFIGVVVVFSLFVRDTEEGVYMVFAMSTYMQFFSVSTGRFSRELTKPYIYLLPEPPFSKMLHALRESLPGAVIEAILLWVPLTLLLHLTAADLVVCVLARVSFALIFQTANVAVMRIWKGTPSKIATMLLDLLVLLLLAAPGIVLSVLGTAAAAALVPALAGSAALSFLIMAVVNIPVALLGLFLCRNMLRYAELNYQ